MKFRTRLQVTFITIIILPLVLTALAFFIIGFCLLYHPAKDLTITEIDYSLMSNGIQSYGKITEELYTQIQGELETDIRKAEDLQYLEAKNNEIKKSNKLYSFDDMVADTLFATVRIYRERTSEN